MPELSLDESVKLARAALKAERLGTALDLYYDIVTKWPERADLRAEMVTGVLGPMGMERHAYVEAVRAIHIDPKCAKAWRAMGFAEMGLNKVDRAIEALDRQIELTDDGQALLDRSGIALDVGDWPTVERLCRRILETENIYGGDALHFLALAAYRQGRHEEAIELDNWALEANCFFPEIARWNQSLALLALGRFKEGWEKHLARRNSEGDVFSMEQFRRFDKPLFDFQPAPAKLHVIQEMGFGDGIIMLRYLPLLIEKGYKIQLEVDSQLVGLLEYSLPDIHVMRKAPNFPGTLGIPDFDYLLPLLSCPLLFKTEPDTIPWNGPYIKANPELVSKFKINTRAERKIGVCWSSGLFTQGVNARWHAEFNRRKSIGIENLKPLFQTFPDDLFVSLQVGPTRQDGEGYVLDVLPKEPNWEDTAALIENLDLVITVDTGVAHLAGAMGKPFWLMMHSEGVWQWFAERPNSPWNEKNPWYPSARLFRAKEPHEWGNVVGKLIIALRDFDDVRERRAVEPVAIS